MSVVTRAAAVAALLLASACSGEPEILEPDPTASSTPSAATPPLKPEELSRPTESGAATFALYWTDVSDYASLTGDTAELKRISSPDCLGCKEYIDYYEEIYEAGGELDGGLQTLSDVTTRMSADNEVVLVRAQLDLARGTVRESATAETKTTDTERNRIVFRVHRSRDGWQMQEVALDE